MDQLVLDLCSGIGGFTLGGIISGGFQTVAFCEINSYCQQVLRLRFEHIPIIISDLKNVTASSLQRRGIHHIDGITAGLPCPAFSVAGKQLGSQDSRNLFPEFFRILRDVRPRWAIVENVPGLLSTEQGGFFVGVLREFADCGYDVEWSVVSAASVGAVHRRERLWIIAYTSGCLGGGCPRLVRECSPNTRSKRCGQGQGEKVPAIDGSIAHSNCWQRQEPHGRNISAQAGTDKTSFFCCDDESPSHRCKQQLEIPDKRREESQLGNGNESKSLTQPSVCLGDDGIPSDVDGYLLRHDRLEEWLRSATIPKFSRLSAEEVRGLTAFEQGEYRTLWREYQQIRKQHKEQLKALGNAIVPSCAARVFDKLKLILKS